MPLSLLGRGRLALCAWEAYPIPVILSGATYLLYLEVGGLLDQPGRSRSAVVHLAHMAWRQTVALGKAASSWIRLEPGPVGTSLMPAW